MSTNHELSKLDDLITTLIDSVKGYDHSADKVTAPSLKALFVDLAKERRAAVEALQRASRAMGGSPNEFGSAAATLHRRVEDVRVALGGGDKVIVAEIERGEDYLKEEFDRVLKDDQLGELTRATVVTAYQSVGRGHAAVSALKKELAA